MRFLTLTLAAMALAFSAVAQPVCAPTWLWFDVEPAAGTTVDSVYFWVTPLNGLTVVYAEGDLGFWNGGTSTSEAQACLPEGCYFVGLTVPEGATWEAHADFVVDDLSWEMTEMEPMYDEAGNVTGYTFCVNSAWGGDCEVAINTELGIGPNGAYLFEATGGPEGAYYTWYVNGSMAQSSDNPLFDWYDMLGAPTWEICVLMDTPIGCVAEDCVTPADLVQDCTLELAGGLNPSGGGVFEAFNYPDSVLINWSIDGNWLNFGGPVLELGPDMLEGVSSVCAFYESPDCPNGAWACMELETTGGGCIDESLIDPNMACIEIWDPVCGCDGITYSNECYATYYGGVTEFTPGECGTTGGCEPVIEAWPSDVPGVWNFQVFDASNPAGGPVSEDMVEWTFNGDIVESGDEGSIQVSFWGTNDYLWVGCATVMCQGAILETCWEWPNPGDELECENVVIAVNAEWGSAAGIDPLELELVLSMMDVELDLDLSQILEGGSFNETLSFCLPAGFCYELEAAIGNLNELEVDLFEIASGVGQELPAWQDVLSALTGPDASWSVALGVDVLEGCDDESGIATDSEMWGVWSYPNPTSGDMTVEAPYGTAMQLRNALGQVVDAWTQSGSRELRSWSDLPAGSYVLEAGHDGTRRRANILILR
ncbi:MAG: hypothetical protein O2990_04825 [Bacteroidetes bacterium]|nr:hypothetical protein [Bacteroidota bacterium]